MIELIGKVAGYYKMEIVRLNADGSEKSRRVAADWFPNLITNAGLNRMGNNSDWLNYCQVGSSTAAPSFTDTALGTFMAGHSSIPTSVSGNLSISPYYAWARKQFRFNSGTVVGSVGEIGVGWAASGSLFSKSRVTDVNGADTTIVVLADEILDVTYEHRFYPKLADATGTIVLTGNKGGPFDWIMRPAAEETNNWKGIGSMGYVATARVYDGDIREVINIPYGSVLDIGEAAQSYVENSLQRKFDITASTAEGNLVSGIRSMSMLLGLGYFQIQFTPVLLKTDVDSLSLTFTISWGRV